MPEAEEALGAFAVEAGEFEKRLRRFASYLHAQGSRWDALRAEVREVAVHVGRLADQLEAAGG